MSQAAQIVANDQRHFCVRGVLNLSTVSALRDVGCNIISQHAAEEIIFDLKEVIRSDSVGLSLLTAWFRYANQKGKSLRFLNVPTQMMDVARLSNLDKVLFL
jgi:phospholipid transport system transporter-binding protein